MKPSAEMQWLRRTQRARRGRARTPTVRDRSPVAAAAPGRRRWDSPSALAKAGPLRAGTARAPGADPALGTNREDPFRCRRAATDLECGDWAPLWRRRLGTCRHRALPAVVMGFGAFLVRPDRRFQGHCRLPRTSPTGGNPSATAGRPTPRFGARPGRRSGSGSIAPASWPGRHRLRWRSGRPPRSGVA